MQAPPDDRIIAARIGLGHEPSGIVLVRRAEELSGKFDVAAKRYPSIVSYAVTTAARVPGGSSQAAVADVIAELAGLAAAQRASRYSVLADVSECGVAFMRHLHERNVRGVQVMIGDAASPRAADRHWQIPMRELLSVTLGLIAEHRLEIAADMQHAETLAGQMESFRTKAPPKDALSEWRPTPQQDLAGALMLACWCGERMLRSIVKQPPAPRIPIDPARPPTFNELMKVHKARQKRTRI